MPTQAQASISQQEAVALTLRIALEHHQRGQLREAAELYREIHEMDPANGDALFLLGLIALSAHNDSAADKLLEAAALRKPQSAAIIRARGEALSRLGRLGAALDSYWRALTLDPRVPGIYVDIAEVLVALKPSRGNDGMAAGCLTRALTLQPHCARAHALMGWIYLRAGRIKEAGAAYAQAAQADPKSAACQSALGAILLRQLQYGKAAESFRKAIRLQPYSPATYLSLGDAFYGMRQEERAEDCYRMAVSLRPDYAKAYLRLGQILAQKGDWHGAIEHFRHSLSLRVTVQACRHLQLAYLALGRSEEAQQVVQTAQAFVMNPAATYSRTQNLANIPMEVVARACPVQ